MLVKRNYVLDFIYRQRTSITRPPLYKLQKTESDRLDLTSNERLVSAYHANALEQNDKKTCIHLHERTAPYSWQTDVTTLETYRDRMQAMHLFQQRQCRRRQK